MEKDTAARQKKIRNRAEEVLQKGAGTLRDYPAEDIQKLIYYIVQIFQLTLGLEYRLDFLLVKT